MFDRAFNAGIVVVALTALVTYVAPGVVVALLARTRPVDGRTVLVGVGALVVARAGVQVLDGAPRYWVTLGAAALAIGVLTLTTVLVVRVASPAVAALGVATGGGVATGISLVLWTWDAIWRSGAPAWVPTGAVLAGAAWCAWSLRHAAPASPGPRRLWVLGPFLGVAVMVVLNPAYLASQLGLGLAVVALALALGLALAAALVLWAMPRQADARSGVLRGVVLVGAAALVLFPFTEPGEDAGTLLAVALVVTVALLVAVATAALATAWAVPLPERPARRAGVALAGSASAVGLGVILPLLVYQVDYDVPLGFPNAFVILAAVVALGLGGLRRTARTPATADDVAAPGSAVDAGVATPLDPRLPYGDGPKWRSAITGTVRLPGGTPVVVTSAHLQHRDENTPTRLAQLEVLMSADIASSPAAVLTGDFNSEPGWPEIAYVEADGYVSAQDVAGDPAELTFPAWEPEVRIDWMFGTGVTFTDVRVLPDGGSDYRGILATVHVTR